MIPDGTWKVTTNWEHWYNNADKVIDGLASTDYRSRDKVAHLCIQVDFQREIKVKLLGVAKKVFAQNHFVANIQGGCTIHLQR